MIREHAMRTLFFCLLSTSSASARSSDWVEGNPIYLGAESCERVAKDLSDFTARASGNRVFFKGQCEENELRNFWKNARSNTDSARLVGKKVSRHRYDEIVPSWRACDRLLGFFEQAENNEVRFDFEDRCTIWKRNHLDEMRRPTSIIITRRLIEQMTYYTVNLKLDVNLFQAS